MKKNTIKGVKAWGIYFKEHTDILGKLHPMRLSDDAYDAEDGQTVYIRPIFRDKKDAIKYAKETYNYFNPKFPKYKTRYQDAIKVIPVLITPIIKVAQNKIVK